MTADPFNLSRFVEAQEGVYAQALTEVRNGRKRSHWMWFIFPQFKGLGVSDTSQFYAIGSAEEARAYLAHPTLGPRLVECAEAALAVEGRSPADVFGFTDAMKLQSSATLFEWVSPRGSVFGHLLDRHFGGVRDAKTIQLLDMR
jgi:uncharacterized protein (DUF1810 family)